MLKRIKHILSILCLGITLTSGAQGIDDKPKLLTSSEIEFLRQGYVQMMQSDIFKESKHLAFEVSLKLNNLPYPNDIELLDKAEVHHWLTENIEKTKFNSIEEAVEMVWESVGKSKQLAIEYAEVYKLLRRATKSGQVHEVFELIYKQDSQRIPNKQ